MKAWEATVKKTQQAAKKRANTFFGASNATENAEEDVNDQGHERHITGETNAEKFLPNGDRYSGSWADNFPHGKGKYRWTDGCMFVGEWCKGKTNGWGIFSWPSGAKYEGNFKNGFMHGEGTYTEANGSIYKGSWVMNLKQGCGRKEYANGDVYEGQWSRGMPEGEGKYQWKNGTYYVGEWRNGKMSGVGKMHWHNGNIYDGNWEDGLPKGRGTFQWPDGDFYVGNWSTDPAEQSGTYVPSGPMEGTLEWDPQDVFNNDLADCQVCPTEKIPIWPSQKRLAVWQSVKASEKNPRPRRLSVDGRIEGGVDKEMRLSDCAAASYRSSSSIDRSGQVGDDSSVSSWSEPISRGTPIRIPKLVKKQGVTISKGHRNYDLMLNLQLGIRHSVGRPGPPPSLDLKPSAFDPKEKFWTKFPPEGSKHTPPHQSSEFKWKDYCPKVFRALRMLFKVDPADYMLSICGNDALRELSSPGKSGSFFYLTNDDRYMIKTMKKAETKTLLRMLSAYFNHVRAFQNTLVTKYYGLHCVKLNGQKVRFIIIGNLFCTEYVIHRRYDLKGSTSGRLTDKPESEIDSNTTLKDLDLNFIFRLQKTWYKEFRRQVDKDCELLEQERIMDYSLLVGLHFMEVLADDKTPPVDNGNSNNEVLRISRAHIEQLMIDPSRWASIQLGINMPARVEMTERVKLPDGEIQLVGEPTGECYDVIMFFGIIDILQDYDITKKLEHAYKSIQYDPNSISAVDPKVYAKRFRDYIFKAFVEDT